MGKNSSNQVMQSRGVVEVASVGLRVPAVLKRDGPYPTAVRLSCFRQEFAPSLSVGLAILGGHKRADFEPKRLSILARLCWRSQKTPLQSDKAGVTPPLPDRIPTGDPMAMYVQDTSSWKHWQTDYRLGLILIIPPPEISDLIHPPRAKYDPQSHFTYKTHVSISDPLRLEMTPELEQEITEILSKIEPFLLNCDEPKASRKCAGVASPITPQGPFNELKAKLHQAAIFEGQVFRRRGIPAHMTIAEFVTIEESWRILDEIRVVAPSGSFLCDRLDFLVPDIDFRFQKVKMYSLGG